MQTTAAIGNVKGESPYFSGDQNPARASQTSLRFQGTLSESSGSETAAGTDGQPAFFRDLNLDQIVDAITAGRDEYNLKPFFYRRLTNLAAIACRHEIMRDLERDALFKDVKTFSERMHGVRMRLGASEKSHYRYQKAALFLEAADIYCGAVEVLTRHLREHEPASRGLLAFRDFLAEYVASAAFQALANEAGEVRAGLGAVRYAVLIKGNSITVQNYDSEPDYTAAVEKTFAKFKQGAAKDYLVKYSEFSGMNHVEHMVLERVALLNPQPFRALEDFSVRHAGFADQTITEFDREVQFYVAWLEYAEPFRRAGLQFCFPQMSDTDKNVSSRDGFDLALAQNILGRTGDPPPAANADERRARSDAPCPVICNDFALSESERIFVVSGPNQGGKTTFARTFGQLHFLASLGLPVPGTEARLFLYDQIFTHFEREEDITTLRGKLEDDLVRIHEILQHATPDSIVIINEIFSSTTLKDAVFLGGKIMERITQLDALCVCVTFLDELSRLNDKTVSLVAEVVPDNPTLRTFKIQKRPADGLAYALAIAEKHRLTGRQLQARIPRIATNET